MRTDSGSTADQPGLIERIRLGDDAAFGELFREHETAVRRLARGLVSDASEAEDVTAETFFRVFQAIRRGNGPSENVRAYLLTVARRVTWEWQAARRDVPVTDDELTARLGASTDWLDWQNRTAEVALITRAFTSLPERWRTVLWRTEVEGEQPAVAASHFGLSANATAALARRARIGLRAAYLQAHLAADRSRGSCRGVVRKLGGYAAGGVTGTEARKIAGHLSGCSSCRSTYDELRRVCSILRTHAGVVVVLVPLSGLALGTSGAGLGVGAAVAAGAGGSATTGGVAAGGSVGASAVTAMAAGSGKVGLSFVSAAAVAGMVGTPVLDVIESGRAEVPTEVGTFIELSSASNGDDGEDGALPGAAAKTLQGRGHRASAAVDEPSASLPGPPADSSSGSLQATEYTLPAESVAVGTGVPSSYFFPSDPSKTPGRSEPSGSVPLEATQPSEPGGEARDDRCDAQCAVLGGDGGDSASAGTGKPTDAGDVFS